MTDNNFEDRLKTLLNERVDAQTGPRTGAPEFDRARVTAAPAKRVRWLFPLAAAACVVLAAAGTVTATQLLGQDHHTHPGVTQTPTAPTLSPPTGTPTGTPTTTTTTTVPPARPTSTHATAPSSRPASSTASADTTRSVRLGGASIALPTGWVSRPLQDYFSDGGSPVFPGWCLTPSSTRVSTDADACPVALTQVQVGGNPLDVDTISGLASDPHPCGQGPSTQDESYADRTLGGRAADWRRWTVHCSSTGQTIRYEQYVVPTVPGWILYSGHATDAIDAAMTRIASGSTLPADDGQVRLMDRGYIRSITSTSKGVRITLDRVVRENGRYVNRSRRTYTYEIATSVFAPGAATPPTVGSLVYLSSNGSRVTDIYVEP